MQELILFLVAVLPIVLLGCFIYRKDINKEPKQLLFKLFIGGIGSTILVLVISLILYIICPFLIDMDYNDLNLLQLLLYVFFSIALIEEGCKWLMVYKLSYNNRHFDELYDMIVYATFVSLGFACLENLLYVYNNGIGVGIGRSFLSIPGHVCFGVFMGYYLSLVKLNQILGKINLSKKYLILSVFMPTLLHTIYDYCLLTGNLLFILIFFIFIIVLYINTIKKVNKLSSVAPKLPNNYNLCPNCGHAVDGKFCAFCGHRNGSY